jgi:signal transduction histidine kinase
MTGNLKSYSKLQKEEIEEQINEQDSLDLKGIESVKAEGLYDIRIQIFNKNYEKIISDSLIQTDNPDEIKRAFNGKKELKIIDVKHQRYLSYLSPVVAEHDTLFVLQVATSLKEMDHDLERLIIIFALSIPFALLITCISAYYISKKAFKPIIQMVNLARNISINNLNQRLDLPGKKDEVFLLGETLNEMIARLEKSFQSQKQFIADASHQIRTPLTIIQSEIELAMKNLKDENLKKSLETSLSELDNLNSLATALLIISKIDASQFPLNLQKLRTDELLIDCLQSMRLFADKKNLKFNISIPDAIEIEADKDKLKIAIQNLIDNAIKYSKEQSIINIECNQFDSKNIIISIEDHGIGILETDIHNIFERFYRSNEVKSQVPGSGLGLAIAKSIIEMHYGSITVESQVGKGSKFIISIPTL